MSRLTVAAALMLLTLGATGCIDSRWGEAKRAQHRNAARIAPAALHANGSGAGADASPRAVRTVRLRVLATPAYQAQSVDWQRQVRDLIDDANEVLVDNLGARIEIDGMQTWEDAGTEASLEDALTRLRARDAGDGVEWVVGMVGGLPKLTASFHQLGMGEVAGKHLVVRAAGKADEHDAIDKAFDELSEEERTRLRRDLKRHRAVSVFLHEIGHTLGALHEQDGRSLMHGQYDRRMSAFGAEAVRLMRITLAHRTAAAEADDPRARDRERLEAIQGSPWTGWDPQERADTITRLEASLARTAAPPPPRAPDANGAEDESASDPPLPAIAGLGEGDARLYALASRALAQGDAEKAYGTARPLFAAHPRLFEVQDLRCKIAMRRGLIWAEVRAECDPLMKLSTAK